MKVGVQPWVPRAVLPSRVPAPQGAVCQGKGLCRLPGSALSLPGELPRVLQGEAVGGRSDPQQGRVLLLLRGCCMGQGCSELQLTPRIFPIGGFKEKVKTRITLKIRNFPKPVFSISYFWGTGGDQ